MRAATLAEIGTLGQDSDPSMNGIVVVRGGYVVFEQYFHGFHEHSYHTINSITKSVLSALVGIALHRQDLVSVDQPLLEFFPEVDDPGVDPRVRRITLRHLVTMTTGWSPDTFDLAEFSTNSALVATALRRPIAHDPGVNFWYDNLGAHLVSVLLTRATSMSTAAFAHATLLGPLGVWTDETPRFIWNTQGKTEPGGPHNFHRFALWDETGGLPWKVDPSGYFTGYAGLHLTVREMAKFGYLYLHGGWWDGVPLVPQDYVRESLQPQSSGGPPARVPYGYLWWLPEQGAQRRYLALGFGGQYVQVVPQLDLVVAIASSGANPNASPGALRPGQILDRFVVPAVVL
jgi:CubicO group peptidase (beta-lactamase class C family)